MNVPFHDRETCCGKIERASYDALEEALTYDAEAIYFATDGMPTFGKVVDTRQIVRVITSLNQFRRATINCVGVWIRGKVFDTFLSNLAERNFGQYRRVGQ